MARAANHTLSRTHLFHRAIFSWYSTRERSPVGDVHGGGGVGRGGGDGDGRTVAEVGTLSRQRVREAKFLHRSRPVPGRQEGGQRYLDGRSRHVHRQRHRGS